MDNIKRQLALLEKRLIELESAQKKDREVVTEIRQIMDELVNMESSAAGQQRKALEKIRNLLKKHEGGEVE